jgi:segregation and condensation protein B
MPIDILIEGLLFYKATPQKKQVIIKALGISAEELTLALSTLATRLEKGATRLVETDTDIQLMTAPELAPFVEALRKDELKGDISKAGAETLAIIVYRGPITRAEIDRIRGVNSSFILRNLMIRGLIERTQMSGPSHSFQATPTLLAKLGITRQHDLPQFSAIMTQLEQFEAVSTKS